ncbi:thermonuclease family protein [Candidatus Saccharibacteria bacterium]|nr:MAG: thermonuclease family protein [Candidatus Saccharibacteria bacterium]
MADFKVVEVIDGDTFSVPEWHWRQKSGTVVRPLGYDTPEKGEPGYEAAKTKLKNLIEGKTVDIRNAVDIDTYGRLLADVFYAGKNLADYFPEYKK